MARDLARVLGVTPSGKTQFEGKDWVVTWCVGHLVELDEPASYDARWKAWRLDTLPMIPSRFKLRASTSAPEQFRAVKSLLRDRRFTGVVNACDAGREGELIFRYVYELAGSSLSIRRLWVSSMTDEALRRGFSKLDGGVRFDRLADAARCRSEADWLVGMNATRAVTVRSRKGTAERTDTLFSVGRVQTPTLALLVARDRAIRSFVPKDYWQIEGGFTNALDQRFTAQWTHARGSRLANESLANALVARCVARGGAGDSAGPRVEKVQTKRVREAPPSLFDLTSLQRTVNRRFGLSAARTLEVAQSLYEKHKVLTYPRTDSRHLPKDMARELSGVFASLEPLADYGKFAAHLSANPPAITRRVFDDAKVSDHHAIIPTGRAIDFTRLDRDEQRVVDLVVRRFLGAFYPDAEFDDTTVLVRVGPGDTAGASSALESAESDAPPSAEKPAKDAAREPPILDALPAPPDRFVAKGRVRIASGWQEVAGIDGGDDAANAKKDALSGVEGKQPLPKLIEGEALDGRFLSAKKQTRAPAKYSEATLLGAMEFAGRSLDDEALRDALKDRGLGTPATRANTIETLIKRRYIAREQRSVVPTALGISLIEALPVPALASAELTGDWEARLAKVERGEESREKFMGDIEHFVRETVSTIRESEVSARGLVKSGESDSPSVHGEPVGRCPKCGSSVVERTGDYACALGASPCGLSIPKRVAQRDISRELAAVLLRWRKSRELHGFTSRAGKRFSAALELAEDGTLRFSFDTGARTDAREEAPPPAPSARRVRQGLSAARDEREAPSAPKEAAARIAKPRKTKADDAPLAELSCPRCKTGTLIAGNKGWGCARWREGCRFVVWFESAGKLLSAAQLEALVTKGRTRKSVFRPGNGPPVSGYLVLDSAQDNGATRFESA